MARIALTLLLLLLPAPVAAHAAPLGALTQLPAPAGCASEWGGSCATAAGLDGAAAIAVSPDGHHAYVASVSADAVAAFARDPVSGRLTQLPGTSGCVSETGSGGRCADGVGLDGAEAVAVSPDGESVYVAARNSNAVTAFARDPGSGRLTQLVGADACVAETAAAGCADGRALDWPTSIAVAPGGDTLYVASRVSDAVAVLARDGDTGALTQLAGADGCISEAGAGGCASGRGLDGASAIALAPDGTTAHVAGRVSDAVATLVRDPASGRLSQPAGPDGCISRTGAAGCAVAAGLDGAAGVAVAPDGDQVLVAASVSRALAALPRRADGALAPGACLSDVPNDSTRGTVGCTQARALSGAQAVAVTEDGANVYVAARSSGGVAAFLRDPASGELRQLPDGYGCVTDSGTGGACNDGMALAAAAGAGLAPAGGALYVAAQSSDAVAVLARNTVARPPACQSAAASVQGNSQASLSIACSDPDGDPVEVSIATPPANGTIGALDPATGTFAYAPAQGFVGEDRIALRASDGILTSQAATVTVTVTRPPRPARRRPASPRTTFLLSRALDGGFANGPSRNATVSHDQRIARAMAFESDATNLVAGDDNGMTDVFLVRRAAPWGTNGTPWTPLATELASTGLGGAPANGRSYRPALDGDAHNPPRCLAFVSEASNLVPGDTNGQPDAFVRDLRSGRIVRVSVDARGRQANGPTTEVQLDGDCERVAFVAAAPSLALTRTSRPAWRTAVTRRPRAGTRHVYVRVLRGRRHDRGFRGLTFLASASDRGTPGNGDSHQVALARDGKSLAFTSTARNLDRGDRNARADVYRRAFPRRFQHLGHGRGAQALAPDTRLVSATARGRAGNGPSTHPSITDQGRWVAFETRASDLLSDDRNGVSDIARADLARRRVTQRWVSLSRHVGRPGNGPSQRPSISGAGEFVLFDSDATNLKPSASVRDDSNGVRDVFLWNAPTGNVSLESRDSENGYLRTPSQHPATSSRGNYVPFESADPLIDVPLADRLLPELLDNPDRVVPSLVGPLLDPDALLPVPLPQVAQTRAPALHQQVYMRYLGPQ